MMNYTKQEVMQFVEEEDVKFIRLAFCDVFGNQKNISIMPGELKRAFEYGIAIDAWSIPGFNNETRSDLFLRPDPSTLAILPWRPEHGSVVRIFCDVLYPDGSIFPADTRYVLKKAIETASSAGYQFKFGAELEFYLFHRDEHGNATKIPYDNAGYMDIAPHDKGENIRREICLTLDEMGIQPESSHHEEGPGQNEIDFRYSDPLTAADNTITFCNVVKTIANRNGVAADFSPKPLGNLPGNGMHINFSVEKNKEYMPLEAAMAGILKHAGAMTLFLNPTDASYARLGKDKAPRYISWSTENRSQLIRIPAAFGEFRRAELRSPDPYANPYIAFALLIYAGLEGIQDGLTPPDAADTNLYAASGSFLSNYSHLPITRKEAKTIAMESSFIKSIMPSEIIDAYINL